MANHKKTIFLIIAAGIIVRLFLFFYFLEENKFFYDDDSFGYIELAENMRLGNGFSNPADKPDGFRTPLYPLFLLSHRIIFGSYLPALITQILLIGVTAYLIFIIAKDFMNRSDIGLIAAAAFLFSPFSLMVSLNFLTQTLFTVILTTAVLMWLKFLKTSQDKYFVYSIVLFAISALTRPIAFLILAPILASLFIYIFLTRDSHFSRRRILMLLLVAIILFTSVMSPWLLRNYLTFGSFSLSTVTYYQLYFYDLPHIYGRHQGISFQESFNLLEKNINEISGQTINHEYARDFAYSNLLKERFIHYLIQMPDTTIITRAELVFKFFIRDGIRYWIHYYQNNNDTAGLWLISVIIERIFLFALFIGMVIAIIYGILSRNENAAIFLNVLFMVILYFAFLTGIMASAGLRFPIEPLFLLLGLSGIDLAIKKVSK